MTDKEEIPESEEQKKVTGILKHILGSGIEEAIERIVAENPGIENHNPGSPELKEIPKSPLSIGP